MIDTVGVREESVLDIMMAPHSDQVHFAERVHLVDKNQLDWTITMDDPVVYAHQWTVTKHFLRSPPSDEVREFVCAENNVPDHYDPSPDDALYEHPDPGLKTRQ